MKLELIGGLPFVRAELLYRGHSLLINSVLVDTGSSGTVFSAHKVSELGLFLEPEDSLRRINGVGGSEFVFAKHIDQLAVGNLVVQNFDIEIGEMDYGFGLHGIVGIDFLVQVNAIVDLAQLEIYTKKRT